MLSHILQSQNIKQVLVFTRTKHGANKLCEHLVKNGIPSAAIHGNKSQNARTKALSEFKQGTIRALVATDIAARGINIDQLPYVINYELPNVPEDYVHRIGRTGRAGHQGNAISLVSHEEIEYLAGYRKTSEKKAKSNTSSRL
jgi:ATP-dependent RNA helicase RhlE